MGEKYKLTVAILTMNRSEQLCEAIQSCLDSELPEKTQFVVVDNASTDDTQSVMENMKKDFPYDLVYHREEENRGVGGGRNICFDLADGEYIYFLDDDAVISPESASDFFVKTVEYMDIHPKVASLTTHIHDEILGDSRTNLMSNKEYEGKKLAFFYLGGSHFLRKSCFSSPLYFNIKYAGEEYAPSIKAIDNGFVHTYDGSVFIIHKPRVNKWLDGTDRMRNIQIRCAAVVYATKKILYPAVFLPVLWAGYTKRCRMYLSEYPGAKKEADAMVREICRANKSKKVRVKTVLNMYKTFGLTVF